LFVILQFEQAFEGMSSLRLAVREHGIYGFKSRLVFYLFEPPPID
jgi:hypothetical protein